MKQYIPILALGMIISWPGSSAFADTDNAVRCKPAKGLVEFVQKMTDFDADEMDTVRPDFEAAFEVKDGGAPPERIFLVHEGQRTDLVLGPENVIENFDVLRTVQESAELCFEDPTRAGLPEDNEAFGMRVGFNIDYLETPGTHSYAQLRDGGSDGRKFYKKMVSGPMSLLVPKMEYVLIRYEDETAVPDIYALKDGARVEGLTIEPYRAGYVVSLDEMDDLDADELRIEGGPYRMTPSPSIKTMDKFMSEESDD